VESAWLSSKVGPRRRYYHLTGLGTELLRRFVRRNLLIFQDPAIASCLADLSNPQVGEASPENPIEREG
jgi:DNA-binding PadR family transcriptional regulator